MTEEEDKASVEEGYHIFKGYKLSCYMSVESLVFRFGMSVLKIESGVRSTARVRIWQVECEVFMC